MSTSIIINIEGYNYGVDVRLTQLAQDIASAFLQSHKIDSEYHSAVELEILRSQVKLSSSLSEAHSHECVLRKKEKIVRCAEERARLADLQVSKLSKSLRNVELMLPVLLHATQGQDKGDVEGKDPDSRSCGYDLHDEMETALRSLMHHYGFVVPERDEGSMTMQEWEKQDHEENCLLHSSSSRSGSPGKIEDSLSKGILFRQTHRSKRSISRLRSSSSEEYDQLSRLRSCSDNNITPAYSWKARYLELLKKFSAVVEERNVAQAEATAAVEEAKRLKACTMTDELILENERLREQTVKLRGEILKLRENIVEVKAAAAQALRTMGALGKEMATSGLLFENEAAELGATSPLSSTLYSTFATPSVSADTHNSGLNHIAAVVGEKRPAPLISPSRLPVRNSSPPKGIFRGHATPPSTSISVSGSAMHSHSGLAAPSEEPYVHIDMLRRDTPPGYEPDCAALPTSSSSSSTPTMPPHETQHSEAASSSSAYAHRHPADGTASPEQDLPPVEDVLELALRSAQVPIVGDRLLRLIFDRYNSQDGRFLMNSFRYLRCLKDCGVTINEEEVVSAGTRWLSYGVVSIVFNDSLKYRPEEHAPVLSAINSHVRNTSTVLTLKGAADPRATSLTHAQFVHAMKMLSLRLYADVIESEFGAAIEFLREPVKSTAAHQALELLLQDKLVPFAVLQDFMPWSLVHLERTLFALHHIPVAFHCLISHSDALIHWYTHYASGRQLSSNSTGKSGSPVRSRPVGNQQQRPRPEDVTQLGMSYKALSKFAHDFGIVPYLLKEPQLFGLFHELQSWTKADPAVAAQVLPDLVSAALSESLNKVPPDRVSSLPAAKPGLERVSVATFVVALCILAMQSFPQDLDDHRVQRLLEWMKQSGGPHIVSRTSS